MALDALILDVDGTLIDANGIHARAWETALEAFGYFIPADRILLEIGKGGDKLVPSLLGERVEEEEGEALRDAHGEAFKERIQEEEVPVFEGAERIFEAAHERGLRVAIATASERDDLEKVLEIAGLDLFELADEIITDSDVDESKPAADTVSAAVEKLALSPAQCAMVGDTPYDAIACRRAGVVCLGVLTGAHSREAMHRAGARVSYEDVAALTEKLDEAIALASPGSEPLTQTRLTELMDAALEAARRGMENGELPIGSVLARSDGEILARGHSRSRQKGSKVAHAELEALRDVGPEESDGPSDRILVSTLEPCVMCLGAAMSAGVDTVVYALPAPQNGGTERCTPIENGFLPRLVGDVGAEESRRLLERWLERHPEDSFVERIVARGEEGKSG